MTTIMLDLVNGSDFICKLSKGVLIQVFPSICDLVEEGVSAGIFSVAVVQIDSAQGDPFCADLRTGSKRLRNCSMVGCDLAKELVRRQILSRFKRIASRRRSKSRTHFKLCVGMSQLHAGIPLQFASILQCKCTAG